MPVPMLRLSVGDRDPDCRRRGCLRYLFQNYYKPAKTICQEQRYTPMPSIGAWLILSFFKILVSPRCDRPIRLSGFFCSFGTEAILPQCQALGACRFRGQIPYDQSRYFALFCLCSSKVLAKYAVPSSLPATARPHPYAIPTARVITTSIVVIKTSIYITIQRRMISF